MSEVGWDNLSDVALEMVIDKVTGEKLFWKKHGREKGLIRPRYNFVDFVADIRLNREVRS